MNNLPKGFSFEKYEIDLHSEHELRMMICDLWQVVRDDEERVSKDGEAPVGESETVAKFRDLASRAILKAITFRSSMLEAMEGRVRRGIEDSHLMAELNSGMWTPEWEIRGRANSVSKWICSATNADEAWLLFRCHGFPEVNAGRGNFEITQIKEATKIGVLPKKSPSLDNGPDAA